MINCISCTNCMEVVKVPMSCYPCGHTFCANKVHFFLLSAKINMQMEFVEIVKLKYNLTKILNYLKLSANINIFNKLLKCYKLLILITQIS